MKEQTRQGRFAHWLMVDDVASTMAFYMDVFGANAILRECLLDGQVLRVELSVGTYLLTLTGTWDAVLSADRPGDAPSFLTIDTADVENLLQRARVAGGEIEPAPDADHPAFVRDPGGQRWEIVPSATSISSPAIPRAEFLNTELTG